MKITIIYDNEVWKEGLEADWGGLVVVVGCSHPGVRNILNAAAKWGKPHALIGGLHGFNQFSLIGEMEIVCAAHCTQYKSQIEKYHPGKYVKGGAGREIKL